MICRRELAAAGAIAFVFTTAPTVGDTGGCGTTPTALDPAVFANARKTLDCERCRECGLQTARCGRACDPKARPDVSLPSTCHPLFHDGEVCVRALKAASCSEYATYVDDTAPSAPTECAMCRLPDDGGRD